MLSKLFKFSILILFVVFISIILFILYTAIFNSPRHNLLLKQTDFINSASIADEMQGFRYKPGYSARKENRYKVNGTEINVVTDIYHDKYGARVSTPTKETPNPVDIISIGGSQTWGQGVPADKTFTAITAKLLNYSYGNFATSGIGGVSSFYQLLRVQYLKPKWIIYGLWEDHLNRNLRKCANTGFPPCSKTFVPA